MYNRKVSRRANRDAPPRGFFRRPRGFIDWPHANDTLPRAPIYVIGWCLFPGATVARVEVSVNGRPPERARLAMERLDIEAFTDHPNAPISAFEHKADLSGIPEAEIAITVEATAHATDGRTLALEPVRFTLAPPEAQPVFEDAAELRARSLRPLRHPRPHEPGMRLLA